MTRILLLLALIALFGAAACAQGGVLVGGQSTPQGVVAGAPASEEITVVRLVYVNWLDVERLTEALGGQVLYLYGGHAQPLGVVNDARDALNTLFTGGSRGDRESSTPEFSTQTGPVTPRASAVGR